MVPHFIAARSEVHFDKTEMLGQKNSRALRAAQLRTIKHIYKELWALYEFAKVLASLRTYPIFHENRTKHDASEKRKGSG